MKRGLPQGMLAGMAIVAAAALTGCGDDEESIDVRTAPPRAVIEKLDPTDVESADLELTVRARVDAPGGDLLDASLSGPFTVDDDQPSFDLAARLEGRIDGEPVDLAGDLIQLPDVAYLGYDGIAYELAPDFFANMATRGLANGPCAEALADREFRPLQYVDEARRAGRVEVGGASTTRLTAMIDVPAAVESLVSTLGTPACMAKLSELGPALRSIVGSDPARTLRRAIRGVRVDLYVDAENVVRRMNVRASVDRPAERRPEQRRVEIAANLTLSAVNGGQQVAAPPRSATLEALLGRLGIPPLEVLGRVDAERIRLLSLLTG